MVLEPRAAGAVMSVCRSSRRPRNPFPIDMEDARTPPQTLARKAVRSWQVHNRRRWEFEKDLLPVDERAPFVCECTSDECLGVVELTMDEYEATHAHPAWCGVLPGHILPDDGGRVVWRESQFWVVEMVALPPLSSSGRSATG